MRSITTFCGVIIGLTLLGVILGQSAGEAGASVAVGVIFGVATAVPVGLALAWLGQSARVRRVEQQHYHDQRVIYVVTQPNGQRREVNAAEYHPDAMRAAIGGAMNGAQIEAPDAYPVEAPTADVWAQLETLFTD